MNKFITIDDVTITNGKVLMVNGETYWLGACEGVYNASNDTFNVGNTWVYRGNTKFADKE